MEKSLLILVTLLVAVSGVIFAGGAVEISTISQNDISRLEKIVEELEPVYAIQKALDSFGKELFPMYNYLTTQKMKLNTIFNEYGLEFNEYNTYKAEENPKLNAVLVKLNSRYSYLVALQNNRADVLRATLAMLKEE
ncbi:MAG: hypothetical protein LBI04_03005 [Treponema sp.]|jgi:hypothetical protein|nr:hypothetical protein [Treponema sp.]